jgi:hypothetical protein
MKKIFWLLMVTIFLSVIVYSQDNNYWAKAKPGSTKVFTISFTDDFNGRAVSGEGDVLITIDGGKSWTINTNKSDGNSENNQQFDWTADIYCSVMQTTDAGITWFPYDKGKQEHFCGVYLKDQNSGYNIAGDFLNKVTTKILDCSKNNELNLLIDHPQQCTEYYRSENEGWALGWCVKDFRSIKK